MATAQEEYTALIHNRVVNPLSEDVYGEIHHIYPRCLGGNDEPENLVKLTPEEHRRKLSEAHKGKATWNKGKHYTEEQRKHISEGLKAMYAARKQRG